MASKSLAAVLGMERKWVGPNQKRGVLSKRDLIEVGGSEAVAKLLQAING